MKRGARTELGIAHAQGISAVFGIDTNNAFIISSREGRGRSPRVINQLILDRKATNEPRPFVIVVEGGFNWCSQFQRELHGADAIVFVSDEDAIEQLGVKQVDKGWNDTKPQIDLDLLLFGKSPGG